MKCSSCGHVNLEGAHFCSQCGQTMKLEGDEHPWIGQLVGGRFQVTSVLGQGGMGVVYAGEQQMGSAIRRVAIKTLHTHLSSDPSVVARFHRECGTVAQLEHANTIKVYDFGAESDGTLYIAMEYVDGHSLEEVLDRDGSLAPGRVLKIFEQICGALHEAHEQGIVHRDLKPENIILTEKLGEKDFVKVLDFGIASRSESADAREEAKLTQQGMVLGTPPYMSPEQFTGVELDRRSDVYSLAVLAYEMLTGRLPFEADTAWQWATQHMTAQPFPMDEVPSAAAVPRSLRSVIMRSLSKSSDERPATAFELLKEMREAMAEPVVDPARATIAMQAPSVDSALRPSHSQEVSQIENSEGSPATQMNASNTQGIERPKKAIWPYLIGVAILFPLGFFGWQAVKEPTEGSDNLPSQVGEGVTVTSAEPLEQLPSPERQGPEPSDAQPSSETTSGDKDSLPEKAENQRSDPAEPDAAEPDAEKKESNAAAVSPSKQKSPEPAKPTKPRPSKNAVEGDPQKCIAELRAGRWTSAYKEYQLSSKRGKSTCASQARRQGAVQANRAQRSGDCGQVATIARITQAMGVSTGRVEKAQANCR
ncbi:MAG: protein kinase [Polyangiaceae bacterium]|nr:protein kinase [Polyangiaceae bacterium]